MPLRPEKRGCCDEGLDSVEGSDIHSAFEAIDYLNMAQESEVPVWSDLRGRVRTRLRQIENRRRNEINQTETDSTTRW